MSSERSPSLLAAYAKAGLAALPLTGRLPLLPGGGGPLPTREWSLRGARLTPATRTRLRELTADTSPGAPLFAPHLLAFPLHMQAMTDGHFPYPAIGTVHLDNLVERHRLIGEDEPLDLRLALHGPQPHRKGATFQLETTATVDGALVWRELSTMLRIGAKAPADAPPLPPLAVPAGDEPGAGPVTTTEWSLPGELGRAYARVSGDLNPIHLTTLSAKAFGFPRAIIHGMWTAARIAGELGDELPAAVSFGVRFERPILLPATVRLDRWSDGDTQELLLRNAPGDRVHARARITPLDSASA